MSRDWELGFLQYQLSPASTSISDHCPMLMAKMHTKVFKGFRFESYWFKIDGFQEVVAQAWEKDVFTSDALKALHIKLARTAKALKKWD